MGVEKVDREGNWVHRYYWNDDGQLVNHNYLIIHPLRRKVFAVFHLLWIIGQCPVLALRLMIKYFCNPFQRVPLE